MTKSRKRGGTGEPGETARRKSLGRAGENVARLYLESHGYRTLEENYRRRGGEIDLVICKGTVIAFVEVKTRLTDEDPGTVSESYGQNQQERLFELSEIWLNENETELPAEFDCRYDLVIVGMGSGGRLEVMEHMVDAFHP